MDKEKENENNKKKATAGKTGHTLAEVDSDSDHEIDDSSGDDEALDSSGTDRNSTQKVMEMLAAQFNGALATEERFRELKGKFDRLKRQKSRLESEFQKLRALYTELEKEKENLTGRNSELNKQTNELRQEKENGEARITQLNAELRASSQHAEKLLQTFNEERTRLETARAEITAANDAKRAADEQIATLRAEAAAAAKDAEEMGAASDKLRAEISDLQRVIAEEKANHSQQLDDANKRQVGLEDNVKELQQKITGLEKEQNEIEIQFKDERGVNVELRRVLDAITTEKMELEEQLKQKEHLYSTEQNESNSTKEQLFKQISDLTDKLKEEAERSDAINRKAEESIARADAADAQNVETARLLEEETARANLAERRLDKNRRKKNANKQASDDASQTVERVQEKLETLDKELNDTIRDLETQNETLRTDLSASEARVAEFERDLTAERVRTNELTAQLERAHKEIEESTTGSNEQVHSLSTQIATLHAERDAAIAHQMELNSKLQETQLAHTDAVKANDVNLSIISQLENELSEMKERLTATIGQLEESEERAKHAAHVYERSVADTKERISAITQGHAQTLEKARRDQELLQIQLAELARRPREGEEKVQHLRKKLAMKRKVLETERESNTNLWKLLEGARKKKIDAEAKCDVMRERARRMREERSNFNNEIEKKYKLVEIQKEELEGSCASLRQRNKELSDFNESTTKELEELYAKYEAVIDNVKKIDPPLSIKEAAELAKRKKSFHSEGTTASPREKATRGLARPASSKWKADRDLLEPYLKKKEARKSKVEETELIHDYLDYLSGEKGAPDPFSPKKSPARPPVNSNSVDKTTPRKELNFDTEENRS